MKQLLVSTQDSLNASRMQIHSLKIDGDKRQRLVKELEAQLKKAGQGAKYSSGSNSQIRSINAANKNESLPLGTSSGVKLVIPKEPWDRSKYSVHDIPESQTSPPLGGDIGQLTEHVPGVAEVPRKERNIVVAEAQKLVKLLPKEIISLERFDRFVDREVGVFYSVIFRRGYGKKKNVKDRLAAVRLVRPWGNLRATNVLPDLDGKRESKTANPAKSNKKKVHIVVAISNRAKMLEKLLNSIKRARDSFRAHVVVVDFNSTDTAVQEMLNASDIDCTYLPAESKIQHFSRALLLQEGINSLKKDDIAFTCDVDMRIPNGLLDAIVGTVEQRNINEGQRGQIFNPIVFKSSKGKPLSTAKANGKWFPWGYGMIAAYKGSFDDVGGYDIHKYTYGWGGEDIELVNRFVKKGYNIVRSKFPGFVHEWHKNLPWRRDGKCEFKWKYGTACTMYDE